MKKSTFILKPLILSVLLILIMFINVTRLLAIDPPTTGSKKWAEDQPFALALSTKDLFNWKPGDNKGRYARSTVPLATKAQNLNLKANAHARGNEAKVHVLSQSHTLGIKNGSDRASHGYEHNQIWAFSYWQYVYSYAVWDIHYDGKNIIAPPADITDAAHRNGVRCYGLIGQGNSAYWDDLLKEESDGSFKAADKLISICEYYGFDGYFYNWEQTATNAQAKLLQKLLIYFEKASQERGLDLSMHFYDAITSSGIVSYQNALTSRNAFFFQDGDKRVTDEFFLNYWYRWSSGQLSRSSEYTKSIGRSPYDVYAGVEMEKGTEDILNSASVSSYWPEIFPERKPHNHSIGLFCPDATTFRRAKDMDDFYLRSNQFWTGQNGDPSNTQTDFHWKGMAHYIPAQTAITTLPFVSNFCTGHGDKFFVEGENRRQSEWANRTFQDIMPTWRWLIKTTGTRLKTEFDWSDAYYGSNCIKVSGNLVADNDLKLFMTELPVSANTQLNLVYKSGKSNVATHMKVGIAFKGAEDVVQYYPVGNSTSEFWNTCKIDLSAHTGKTIAAISVMFEGTGGADYIMKLGRIAVLDGDPVKPSAPSGLTVDSKKETSVDVGTVLLSWNHSSDINNYNIYYYNVYRRNKDNSLTHLGGSTCDGYFVQEVHREGEEETATIVVEAVSLDFAFSETTSTTITWDRPTTLLSAKFSADRPKCFTSQEVHFSDESLNGPTEWLWSFPGGTPSTSTEKNPIVVYNAVGAYDVSLSIKNDTEASKLIKTAYISIEENRKPVADFSVDDNEVLINKEVRFLLNSPAAQSYEWNFPGGTPSKSSEKNPTVYYESAGQYDVTLKVVNNLGESTKTSTSLINVREASNKVLNLGDSDYLNIDKPNELFGADECTIEMWFKIDPNFTVASKGFVGLFKTVNTTTNRLALNLSKALDKFQVLWGNGYNGYGNFNTTINKDTWYHLALVYDNNKVGSGRVVLYLNGERLVSNGIASGNWEGLVPDVNMDMKVMEGVNGQLDNFRIWKSALSLTQLNEVSLKTINASHSLSDKLITQYTFEKQFGNTFLNTKDDSKYVATLMPESYSDLVKLIGVEKPAIDNTDLPTLISIDPINKDIRISPNPVVDEFKINGVLSAYDYSIYNVTGLLVMKGKANGQSVDVSHLSSGIYIVLINNGAVLKFIKK